MKIEPFHFEGTYRVQSFRTPSASKLTGGWLPPGESSLTLEDMNRALTLNADWLGKATITLRPGWVEERTGAFASHADALYYHRFFSKADSSPAMEGDILDVRKLTTHWRKRDHFLHLFFSEEQYETLVGGITSVEITATNEYMCHEAGHLLGIDVHTKYDEGYFRLGGRVAWPLIYVEEFRADLESFAFALKLLPLEQARAIFAYHLCHRFGLACESGQTDCESAGAVPYLLFYLLKELGILRIKQEGGRKVVYLENLKNEGVERVMCACAEHAAEFLTRPEMEAASLLDAALVGAEYYRKRALDETTLDEFWHLVSSSQPRQQILGPLSQ